MGNSVTIQMKRGLDLPNPLNVLPFCGAEGETRTRTKKPSLDPEFYSISHLLYFCLPFVANIIYLIQKVTYNIIYEVNKMNQVQSGRCIFPYGDDC